MAAAMTGCAKKQTVKQDEPTKQEPARTEQGPITRPDEPATPAIDLRVVYFEFDSYEVREDAKPVLRIAKMARENGALDLRLEGHADERGTVEYNLALGERRAAGVRDYLAGLGVAAGRMAAYSYGEERPAVPGHDELGQEPAGGDRAGEEVTEGRCDRSPSWRRPS
ncbi:MAG: OmpA family protein [Candidatus Edwardsbacteria bacterium]|nr:OmpA family protein [Candidatus Edwardsbacteria bacterium]